MKLEWRVERWGIPEIVVESLGVLSGLPVNPDNIPSCFLTFSSLSIGSTPISV